MYLCVTFWEAEQRGKLDTRQHFVYECNYQRTLISWRCIRHPHIGLTGINLHTRGVEMSTNMQIYMKKRKQMLSLHLTSHTKPKWGLCLPDLRKNTCKLDFILFSYHFCLLLQWHSLPDHKILLQPALILENFFPWKKDFFCLFFKRVYKLVHHLWEIWKKED